MAAEYSRELSVKVFSAQKRLVELGWRMGQNSGCTNVEVRIKSGWKIVEADQNLEETRN
jgi:hypothetical protein